MQDRWINAVTNVIETKSPHRLALEEYEIELRLLEMGLNGDQCEQIIELIYDYADDANPKIRRV